jgi:hypothetical protein
MIYLECYTDEALARALGVHSNEIFHSGNKGNVCRNLAKKQKSTGLVDEDPFSAQPGYFGKLKIRSNENNIKLMYDDKNKNYLIILCPRLEDWILKAAKESRISMKDYNLPDDAYELHKINFKSLKNFTKLIEDMEKRKCNMLRALVTFLRM